MGCIPRTTGLPSVNDLLPCSTVPTPVSNATHRRPFVARGAANNGGTVNVGPLGPAVVGGRTGGRYPPVVVTVVPECPLWRGTQMGQRRIAYLVGGSQPSSENNCPSVPWNWGGGWWQPAAPAQPRTSPQCGVPTNRTTLPCCRNNAETSHNRACAAVFNPWSQTQRPVS